jgi:hypothetical protein
MRPDLIVIGAMKAGTTSLHNYLDAHPDIAMSAVKETHFFSNPKYWSKGIAWYESHFNEPAKLRGETSTTYAVYPKIPDVPRRMSSLVPDAKLIYLVRDPVDRFLSHYVHFAALGLERRPFGEVVEAVRLGDPMPYLFQSLYYSQIERYLEFFKADQILILATETLQQRREVALGAICGFLGLPYDFPPQVIAKQFNKSEDQFHRSLWSDLVYPRWLHTHPRLPWKLKAPFYRLAKLGEKRIERPRPSPIELEILTEAFRSDVQKLRDFTGASFADWRAY